MTANDSLALKEMSNDALQGVLDMLIELRKEGRSQRVLSEIARKDRLESIRNTIIEEVTGGQGLKGGAAAIGVEAAEPRRGRVRDWMERFVNRQYAWADLLDKLSKFTKADPFRSNLSMFGRNVRKANLLEFAGREAAVAQLKGC